MKNNSKKEIYLLIGLLAFLVGLLYYMVIYPSLKSNYSDSVNDKSKAISEYDKVTAELATLKTRKSEIKSKKGEALNKSKRFYPDIIEENLIIELEDMANAANFKSNFTLDDITVNTLEDMTPNNETLPPTSFDALNDAINQADDALDDKSKKSKVSKDISKNVSVASSTVSSNSASGNNSNSNGNNSDKAKTSQATCKILSINVDFTDQQYKDVKSFLYSLENYGRIVAVNNFKVVASETGNTIAGSFDIELYAIPKVKDNDDKHYSDWTKNDAKGKEDLFAQGAATGVNVKKDQDDIDFICILKRPDSVYPSVTFGKNDDKDTSTYVYADSDNKVKGTITFTKDKDGNYYYKYSIGSSNYPKSTMGDGEKFEPTNNAIDISVESDIRSGLKDKAGLDLTIINNTKLPVNVKVNGDSKSDKRFNEDSKGSGSVYMK